MAQLGNNHSRKLLIVQIHEYTPFYFVISEEEQ